MNHANENIILLLKSTDDYFKLYSLLEKEITDITIDIQNRKSIFRANRCFNFSLIYYLVKKRVFAISVSTNQVILDYLKTIKFVNFCKFNYNESTTIKSIDSFTAMPICRVEKATMDNYIQSTQKYFTTFCEGKDLGMLNLCLSELINNVYNHSHSAIGHMYLINIIQKRMKLKLQLA